MRRQFRDIETTCRNDGHQRRNCFMQSPHRQTDHPIFSTDVLDPRERSQDVGFEQRRGRKLHDMFGAKRRD